MSKSARNKTRKRKSELRLIDSDKFRRKLKIKHIKAKSALLSSHPKALKFLEEKGLDPAKIRQHSGKILGTGLLAGALLLQTPNLIPSIQESLHKDTESDKEKSFGRQETLKSTLSSVLPKKTRPLYRNEEKMLEQVLSETTGVKVKASLEGEHLNTTYGRIGAEQHLRRYPGDTLSLHGNWEDQKEGMAPGLGAWGYFAPSKDKLTEDLVETEKWYAVVQTLYLPDWNTRTRYLRQWYKYRKVLIVNTQNGQAVVASIADSGPAAWTGKHYGGSPEVMDYLGGAKYKKGPVIVFFVDDPDNKVSLGPVEY